MSTALNRVIDAIVGALDLFRFWIVLDDYERGVILRFGKFHRELGPGLHWRYPMRTEVLKYLNVRKKAGNPWESTNTTSDGTAVTTCFSWCVSVDDSKHVLLNIDNWDEFTYRITAIAVANVVHESSDEHFFGKEFLRECELDVRQVLAENGLKLCEFGITQRAETPAFRLFKGAN